MTRLLDLTGKKFNRLTAIKRSYSEKKGVSYWICVCECGNEKNVRSSHLREGRIKSCGCLNIEMPKNLKHGHTITGKFTKEYNAWGNMLSRCTNKKVKEYVNYGGRGISVCEPWINSFESFLKDMGQAPSPVHSLERIDVNGNYEPQNCKWATREEQSRNKRHNKTSRSQIKGVTWNSISGKWAVSINVNKKRIHLGYFKELVDAAEVRKKAEQQFWGKSS